MKPLRSPAKRVGVLDEHEQRHLALLVERMSQQGGSEREIVTAVEQALSTKRPAQ